MAIDLKKIFLNEAKKAIVTVKKAVGTTKAPIIKEYDSPEDWLLSVMLVAILYVNPGLDVMDAIVNSKAIMRKLAMPESEFLWKKQANRINRRGIRAEVSRIRRELYSLM